jgi:hypothetical protein
MHEACLSEGTARRSEDLVILDLFDEIALFVQIQIYYSYVIIRELGSVGKDSQLVFGCVRGQAALCYRFLFNREGVY